MQQLFFGKYPLLFGLYDGRWWWSWRLALRLRRGDSRHHSGGFAALYSRDLVCGPVCARGQISLEAVVDGNVLFGFVGGSS
jgi:hypothetical protein